MSIGENRTQEKQDHALLIAERTRQFLAAGGNITTPKMPPKALRKITHRQYPAQ